MEDTYTGSKFTFPFSIGSRAAEIIGYDPATKIATFGELAMDERKRIELNDKIADFLEKQRDSAYIKMKADGDLHIDGFIDLDSLKKVIEIIDEHK